MGDIVLIVCCFVVLCFIGLSGPEINDGTAQKSVCLAFPDSLWQIKFNHPSYRPIAGSGTV